MRPSRRWSGSTVRALLLRSKGSLTASRLRPPLQDGCFRPARDTERNPILAVQREIRSIPFDALDQSGIGVAGDGSQRVNGGKLELTTIPDAEWKTVEDAAVKFWDEIAAESEVKAKVVEAIKTYNDVMNKSGRPYRYG